MGSAIPVELQPVSEAQALLVMRVLQSHVFSEEERGLALLYLLKHPHKRGAEKLIDRLLLQVGERKRKEREEQRRANENRKGLDNS